jgi:hypothetical protein
MIAASWTFMSSGTGLFNEIDGQSPFHCRDLKSSGSDDETALILLWLLGLSALIRLTMAKRPINRSERLLFGAISAFSGLFLFVLPDCGSLIFTAVHTFDVGLNLTLMLWLVTGVLYFWPSIR